MNLEEFEDLKKKFDAKHSEMERKKGELAVLMKTLRETYGCSTVQEAKNKLTALDARVSALKTRMAEKLDDLERRWTEYEESRS